MDHQSFVLCDGPEGNNGKSTLRRCISAIAPQYQASINKGLVVASKYGKNHNAASNEITNLGGGIRFGFADELTVEEKMDIESIKEFCGQTEMTLRRNYHDTERCWSHDCSLWINTNSMPKLPSDDPAFRRRCIILDFIATFVDYPDLEKTVEDSLGCTVQAEYKKDLETEEWIIKGDGKQIFFNLMIQLFTKSPKMPASVKRYTAYKFDQQDTVLIFVKDFLQPHNPQGLDQVKKNALTISIKSLMLLYKHYVKVEKLGKPVLTKHMKEMLKSRQYTIVKTNRAIVARGVLLNMRMLKLIYTKNPQELSNWFYTNLRISLETYESMFTYDESLEESRLSYMLQPCNESNDIEIMRPDIERQNDFNLENSIGIPVRDIAPERIESKENSISIISSLDAEDCKMHEVKSNFESLNMDDSLFSQQSTHSKQTSISVSCVPNIPRVGVNRNVKLNRNKISPEKNVSAITGNKVNFTISTSQKSSIFTPCLLKSRTEHHSADQRKLIFGEIKQRSASRDVIRGFGDNNSCADVKKVSSKTVKKVIPRNNCTVLSILNTPPSLNGRRDAEPVISNNLKPTEQKAEKALNSQLNLHESQQNQKIEGDNPNCRQDPNIAINFTSYSPIPQCRLNSSTCHSESSIFSIPSSKDYRSSSDELPIFTGIAKSQLLKHQAETIDNRLKEIEDELCDGNLDDFAEDSFGHRESGAFCIQEFYVLDAGCSGISDELELSNSNEENLSFIVSDQETFNQSRHIYNRLDREVDAGEINIDSLQVKFASEDAQNIKRRRLQ